MRRVVEGLLLWTSHDAPFVGVIRDFCLIAQGGAMPSADSSGRLKLSAASVLRRRGVLRIGTLLTALTGATAMAGREATAAHAAPGDKSPSVSYVPTAEKGAATGVATLDVQAKIPQSQIPDLSVKYVPLGISNETGIYRNSPDKVSWTIGNAPGSAGFPGTGTPQKALGALAIYQKFGDEIGSSNTPVPNTTQAAYVVANYYGPTLDDSAEAFSTFVGIKNTGKPFTQTRPVTGFEAIAQVESGNTLSGPGAYALGVGSRINVLEAGHIDDAFGFKASVNSSGGTTLGTMGRYIAYYQPVPSGATQAWGVYAADPIQSEKSLVVARSGDTGLFKVDFAGSGGGSPGFLYAQNPKDTDMATLRLQAIPGQTRALAEFWAAGSPCVNASITRLGTFISTAGFSAQNSSGVNYWSFDKNGPKWAQSALTQNTVGPPGGAALLPSTPKRYLKVVDSDGTMLVIPAYLAS